MSAASRAEGREQPEAARLALPARLGVEETLRFLGRVLPPAPARLLEVGCGNGAVARALADTGYDVTGLDESRPEAGGPVPTKGGAGRLRWIEADFLYYEENDPYDAVLFTRSLHHMSPVGAALGRAHALLGPNGVIVAEEFAYDRPNIQTARWLYDLESVLAAAGLFAATVDDPARVSDPGPPGAPDPATTQEAASEGNPLGRWRREHATDPPLATGHAILAAARERFELTAVEEAPYLYRYLCERLEPSERGSRVGRRLLELEERLIRERDIAAAGLRFVGRMEGPGR